MRQHTKSTAIRLLTKTRSSPLGDDIPDDDLEDDEPEDALSEDEDEEDESGDSDTDTSARLANDNDENDDLNLSLAALEDRFAMMLWSSLMKLASPIKTSKKPRAPPFAYVEGTGADC